MASLYGGPINIYLFFLAIIPFRGVTTHDTKEDVGAADFVCDLIEVLELCGGAHHQITDLRTDGVLFVHGSLRVRLLGNFLFFGVRGDKVTEVLVGVGVAKHLG